MRKVYKARGVSEAYVVSVVRKVLPAQRDLQHRSIPMPRWTKGTRTKDSTEWLS